jgi:hypothetical protein
MSPIRAQAQGGTAAVLSRALRVVWAAPVVAGAARGLEATAAGPSRVLRVNLGCPVVPGIESF